MFKSDIKPKQTNLMDILLTNNPLHCLLAHCCFLCSALPEGTMTSWPRVCINWWAGKTCSCLNVNIWIMIVFVSKMSSCLLIKYVLLFQFSLDPSVMYSSKHFRCHIRANPDTTLRSWWTGVGASNRSTCDYASWSGSDVQIRLRWGSKCL